MLTCVTAGAVISVSIGPIKNHHYRRIVAASLLVVLAVAMPAHISGTCALQ